MRVRNVCVVKCNANYALFFMLECPLSLPFYCFCVPLCVICVFIFLDFQLLSLKQNGGNKKFLASMRSSFLLIFSEIKSHPCNRWQILMCILHHHWLSLIVIFNPFFAVITLTFIIHLSNLEILLCCFCFLCCTFFFCWFLGHLSSFVL